MANIFENIISGVGEGLSAVGQGIRGGLRAIHPGAAQAADLRRLQQQLAVVGGVYTPGGQQLIKEYFEKAKTSPELKNALLQQGSMMGGAFGGMAPEGYEATKVTSEFGKPPSYTFEPENRLQFKPGVIENTKTGKQQPYNYGDTIPEGYKIVNEAKTEVNVGLQPASASERTQIAETRASIDALNNLKTLFDSASTQTGPIAGRVAPIAGLFGKTTKKMEEFMAATFAFKNAIIKEITGAQMSEAEATRIMRQVPDITDPPQRWIAKWEQSKKNLEMVQKRRLEILKQSGLTAPEKAGGEGIEQMSDEELIKIIKGEK